MIKACHRCNELKPLDMFYRRADSRDGRQYICKGCMLVGSRKWAAENPARIYANSKAASERDKVNGWTRSHEWRRKNRGKVNASAMRSYRKSRGVAIKKMADWRVKNKGLMREIKARYRRENREKVLVSNMQRRSLRKSASGFSTLEQIRSRVAYYGGKCYLCKARPYEHLDHVIPLSRGGSNWPANIRPACSSCNLKKNDRLLSEVI